MKTRMLCLCLMIGMTAAACAPAEEAHYARLRDLPSLSGWKPGEPLVLEVDKGDTLPLRFSLDGPLFQSAKDAPPIVLEATRHFYVRIDHNGLRSSLDGKDFGASPAKPGQFQIGFGVSPKGAEASIAIRTPVPHGGAK
jgi:hypothetical protein